MTDHSIPPQLFICNTCAKEKPLEAFQLHKSGKPHPPCKSCRSLANAEWRAKNKEYNKRKKHEYYLEHRDEIIAQSAQWAATHSAQKATNMQQWNATHKEERHVYNQEYADDHAEEIAAQRLGYREANREKLAKASSEYGRLHPDVVRNLSARKRAQKRHAKINDLTPGQFLEICQALNFRCVYCPQDCKACKRKTHKLQQEHITALARGGNNTVTNVLPACPRHNYAKHTGPPLIPVQPFLLTIEPSKPHRPRKKKTDG
jgi:hypothetical protein